MAIQNFSFDYDENPYLKSALDAQLLAIDEAQKQYTYQSDRALASAKQTQAQANRTANIDYYNAINPYGAQTDALASGGLLHSGLTQSNAARGYSSYQNTLGQSSAAYANAQADINTSLLGYSAQANSDKQGARASYMNNLASDYTQSKALNFDTWQDYQNRMYTQSRDQLEDERYNREWAYTTRKK